MSFGPRIPAVLMVALSATVAGAQAIGPALADTAAPSAIEQALIEHACSATTTTNTAAATSMAAADPYKECLSVRLHSMRGDFGRDLGRLSASERRALDSACNDTLAGAGREAYLDCIRDQLGSVRERWNRANRALLVVPALPDQSVGALPVSLVTPAGDPSSPRSGRWLGVGIVTLVLAAGGALLATKSRRAAVRKCRVCGTGVPGSGDLCPGCRHEAAEALRHAAVERANQERTQEQERRRHHEEEEEQRRQKLLDEEEGRRRLQDEMRRLEENALRRRKEEDELRQKNRAVAPSSEQAFDPYAVLGVPRGASTETIDAAYQEARAKYAPDQVAHLGAELQEHYRRKAEAVDQAYLTLIG